MLALRAQTYSRALTGLATRSLPCASHQVPPTQVKRTYATDTNKSDGQNQQLDTSKGGQHRGIRAENREWTFDRPKQGPRRGSKFSDAPPMREWKHKRSLQQRSTESGRDNRGYDYQARRAPDRDRYQGRGTSDRYQERRGEGRDQERRNSGGYQTRNAPGRGGYQGRRAPDREHQGRGDPNNNYERRAPDRSRQTVRVENLPPDANFTDVASLFSQYGPILSSRLFDAKAQKPNSALITFGSVESAEAVVNDRTPLRLGGKKLRCSLITSGRRMDVQPSPQPVNGPSLLVYNVPSETTVDEITETFGKVADVSNVEITIDEATGERAHSLQVNFTTPEDARKAFEHHRTSPFDLGEGELTLRYVPIRAPPDPSENPDFSRMRRSPFLRVNGLPKYFSRDGIYHIFQQHADVKNIIMEYFPDGQPMPLCFVEFGSNAEAEAVMSAHQNHQFQLSSTTISLHYAPDPAEQEAPPDKVLKVSGFQGGLDTLKAYFDPYSVYIEDMSLLPTSQALFTNTRRVMNERWAIGFVRFDTVEHATLAKERLSRTEVDYGVRLRITYAWPQKVPAEPGGMWGNDNGDEEFAFGKKDGVARVQRAEAITEESQSGRGRFSYKQVDWVERPAAKRNW